MNKTIIKVGAVLLLFCSQESFSFGKFFNTGSAGMTFNIKTTTSPANYIDAGIKVDGKGYKLFCPGTVTSFGYCIFKIAHDKPHNTIGLQGLPGVVNLDMCLSGSGPATCANYTVNAAPIRGVNYDPAHSVAYNTAQQANNQPGMKAAMAADFNQIKKNGFKVVKTFISVASTNNGQLTNLADIACPKGLKLMLGVFEFTPAEWTKPQVDNAISSAKKYPDCIVAITVGNEDIYNGDFTVPNTQMQQRISNDISTIKGALGSAVPVGTAQQDGALLALAQPGHDPYGIIPKLDFVGANIYPYWSPMTTVAQAPKEFANRLAAVRKAYPKTRVVVTEEGWPSSSNTPGQKATSVNNEITYYKYWLGRAGKDTFDSYYFAFYDKVKPNDGDANNYFGLCTYTGASKSASLFACTKPSR